MTSELCPFIQFRFVSLNTQAVIRQLVCFFKLFVVFVGYDPVTMELELFRGKIFMNEQHSSWYWNADAAP